MHRSIYSLFLYAIFLLSFSILSCASPIRQLQTLERTTPSRLVPRVFEGFPVAESDAGGWRILLKQHALFLPVRDAIQEVSPDVCLFHAVPGPSVLSTRRVIDFYLASTTSLWKICCTAFMIKETDMTASARTFLERSSRASRLSDRNRSTGECPWLQLCRRLP